MDSGEFTQRFYENIMETVCVLFSITDPPEREYFLTGVLKITSSINQLYRKSFSLISAG